MDEHIYRLRIALDGGAIVEAEVSDPVIELNAERTRVVRFDWHNPTKDKGRICLAFVDPSRIAAITLEELPAGKMAFEARMH